MFEFLKKKKQYDTEGFDSDGYNRLGFDRMGFDRDGYDIHGFNKEGFSRTGVSKETGLDAEGYDAEGFNLEGFNRAGFNREGFNVDGFDINGFDKNGFDAEGFNAQGFNRLGFDINGYDSEGYNKDGLDKDGFDKEGYNKEGFDHEGFDRKGYDVEGYDKNGFNKSGFNRTGYDKAGYDKDGYDAEGYNKKGFNVLGFDREGYDKKGYDREGFNREGFDKSGFDREGYDKAGFNKQGFDKNGYDTDGFNVDGYNKLGFDNTGYNADGYDAEGYDKAGFNLAGISKLGYKKEDFDDKGYHKSTGLDVRGFNRFGFNVNGINKHTGRDRLGFDADGFDVDGFNIWGINPETEKDKYGNPLSLYENDSNFTEEKCVEFQKIYYEYMAGKYELAGTLASAYCYGKGTVRDFRKALRVLIDTAYEYADFDAIRELSDYFYIGEVIQQNITMALYLNDIVDSKQTKSINQYKAGQALKFTQPVNMTDKTYIEESRHLQSVLDSIRSKISSKESGIVELDRDTSWMDRDQRLDWVEKRSRNSELYKEIEELELVERKPYYGRMDVIKSSGTEKVYIGENGYMDLYNPANSVASVWSDLGAHFRDNRTNSFSLNGHSVTVMLRRKFVIENGKLLDFFDEYDGNSEAGKAEITDPYLLHILEEKRGEKNITNIIRSIQGNQNDIIEEKFDANIVVQGCAGSGKTMILLHRLANLKYKNMSYDWSNVKIITPNHDFTLFIDELSKDLKINDIEKLTLPDYYIKLITQYYDQFLDRVEKEDGVSTVHYKNYSAANETKKVRKDSEWNREIVEYIYSNQFKKAIKDAVKGLKEDNEKLTFSTAWVEFDDVLHAVLESKFEKVARRIPNYNCILYAKVLFLYTYLGKVQKNVKMLCIDEGQDICENQYVLLYEVNGKNTCLNVYGDLSQRISDNVSISDWDNLKSLINAKYYVLNENYRNSEDIIKFYNKQLKINNKSFGLTTKPVEQFNESELDILVKLQLLLKNRTVIITKDKSRVPQSVLSLCVQGSIAENYISVMDVLEVKGLEFDTAFVFDEGMDTNERYISYTRALSELYIQSSKGVNSVALGFGDEKKVKTSNSRKDEKKSKTTTSGKSESEIEITYEEDAVYFDEDIELINESGLYLTMLDTEMIQDSDKYPDCLAVRLCLRKEALGELKLVAKNVCIDGIKIYDKKDIFIPNNSIEEQVVSFAIPAEKVNDEDFEEISFSVVAELKTGRNKYTYASDEICCDPDGYLLDDEEEDDEEEEEEIGYDNEIRSISALDDLNRDKCLIVVRSSWKNDFCFVVERYEGGMARGTQFLNGNEYRETGFNMYSKEFRMYQGPSRQKIEDQYN